MLGNYISKYFPKAQKITRKDFDIIKDNIKKLQKLLLSNSIVINCIGLIPQRNNSNQKEYLKVNSIFPNELSIICSILNIKLIHITTDCVFSGKKGNYIETDNHDEKNIYGQSKSLGEPDNCTIIRTSIIGEELKNKKSLLEWVKSNKDKEINGYINHYWNGLTCLELAKLIEYIINNNLYWVGVKHFFSPKSVSKYELVKIINNTYNLNIKTNKYKTKNSINKTLNTIYKPIYTIKSIEEQIKELQHFNIT